METITEQKELTALTQLRTKLGRKAKLEPNFRFYTLYHLISRDDVLLEAWKRVKRNRGTAGYDGISIKDIVRSDGGAAGFLKEIQNALRSKTYHPSPVKRVFIPKSNGKLRPLGIPTVKDRVVQTALLLIIEPIFEQDFLDCSFGFRPKRSAHQAVGAIHKATAKGQLEVYDADLQSYFDTIPHDNLMKAVERRIVDRQVLKLIRKWLVAPIWEPGKPMNKNDKGTPQGGIISPLLANLYMHWFDKLFHGSQGPGSFAKATLVRYADDFLILAKYMTDRITHWVESTLEGRFKLSVNRTKTKIVDLKKHRSNFNFLGFTFQRVRMRREPYREFCLITPSKKSILNAYEQIRNLTSFRRGRMPMNLVVRELNMFLRGYGEYYRIGNSSEAFRKVNVHVQSRVYRFLQRRSQRGFKKRDDSASWYNFISDLGVIQLTKGFFSRMNA